LELAAAYVKVARVQGFPGEPNLGRIADARKSLEKSVGLYVQARPRTPAELEGALEPLARSAFLESDQSNYDKSLEWSGRALALASSITLEQMTPSLASGYALTRVRMHEALEGRGESEAAYQAVRDGERILRDYARLDKSGKFDARPKSFLENLEIAARGSGRLEESLAASAEWLRKVGSTPTTRSFFAGRTGEVYCSIDEPSWDDPARALPLVNETIQALERNLRIDPNDINIKHALAVNKSKIAYYLLATNPQEAVHAMEYTIGLFEAMVRQDPANNEFPSRLARYRARMALARSYLGQRGDVEQLTKQVLEDPSVREGRERLHVLNLCGMALAHTNSRTKAEAVFQEAAGIARKLMREQGLRMGAMIEATRTLEEYAAFLRGVDAAAAVRLLEQSRRVWQEWKPVTTYVRLRQERSERLLIAPRGLGDRARGRRGDTAN